MREFCNMDVGYPARSEVHLPSVGSFGNLLGS